MPRRTDRKSPHQAQPLEATLLARLAASTAMAKQSESEIPVSVECASSAAYLVPTVLAKIQTRAQQILSDLSTSNYTRDMVDIVGPGLNQMIQKCEQLKTQNQSVAMAQMLISEANARPLLESAAPYGIEDAASYATCCGSLPEETRLQCLEQAVEWWETEQQNLGTLTWAFYDNCQHMKDYETHYDNMCQPPVVYQQCLAGHRQSKLEAVNVIGTWVVNFKTLVARDYPDRNT